MISISIQKKKPKKRGPSYWKFNSSILENKDYTNKITSFWQRWQERKRNYEDPTIWWDNGKKLIQGITKDFCTELKEFEENQLHEQKLELQTLHIKKAKIKSKLIT